MTSDTEKKSTCKKPQRPQIPYKKLKQTQKARISRWMFEAVCKYYKEHQQMPPEECLESMCRELYPKLHGTAPKASFEDLLAVFRKKQAHFAFEDLLAVFRKKQAHFAERIEKNGLPEPPKPKVKKTEAEKLAIKRARRRAKKKKLKAQQERLNDLPDWQDDRFFFIAGYTSGGAPYGVTWEEMGLNPWEKLE